MGRMMPPIVDATVVQQVPDQYRLFVSVDMLGGQIVTLPVDVITHGHRDAVRGDFPPLPKPGTRGVVVFTRGDERTGRWLGAQAPSLPDASAMGPGLADVRYRAGYAGEWAWQDAATGGLAMAWPDGTSLLLGPSGFAMPSPTRHTVNPAGQAVRTPFTAAQRRPGGSPGAYALAFDLGNGAKFAVSSGGAVTGMAAAGQTAVVMVSGGGLFSVNADGSFDFLNGAGVVTATLTAAGVWETLGDQVALAASVNFISQIGHTHTQGDDTHGDGEEPTSAPTPGT